MAIVLFPTATTSDGDGNPAAAQRQGCLLCCGGGLPSSGIPSMWSLPPILDGTTAPLICILFTDALVNTLATACDSTSIHNFHYFLKSSTSPTFSSATATGSTEASPFTACSSNQLRGQPLPPARGASRAHASDTPCVEWPFWGAADAATACGCDAARECAMENKMACYSDDKDDPS